MEISEKTIIEGVARETELPLRSVEATILLLDEGATVPFIARYRKELTGSLDEVAIRAIENSLKRQRELAARKKFVAEAIKAAGVLNPEIESKLRQAATMTEVEDIYAPYKPKKRTRATIARERGLEPLAKIIMAGNVDDPWQAARRFTQHKDVPDEAAALAGAADIIAEWASESPRLRNITRNTYRRHGQLQTAPAKGKEEELAASPFAQYGDYSQSVRRMSSHQYLAMRRAEAEGFVKVKYSLDEASGELEEALAEAFTPRRATRSCSRRIGEAVADSSKRLLRPSIETEISAELKEEADRVAIDIFSENLRQLLLASPLKGKRVLAIDPGYRTGCKTVALDSQGNLLDEDVIYPTAPRNDIEGSRRKLESLISSFKLNAIALGNGTASRETEKFLKDSGLMPKEAIYVVSEQGASVYSASDIARKEFPDKDVTVRGAVSIGRRLIDPLAELVKIDPKSIGVGQYQHDVDQAKLKEALDYTVMSCVNSVGVDVNTASERLLSYVSGIGPALAANIVAYRREHGDFRERKELKKVARLGDKAFELCAGFLRIPGGKEPLDNTGIHPESYRLVKKMAASAGVSVADLPGNDKVLESINIQALAKKGEGGLETMKDIIAELRKPGRDPRLDGDNEAFVPGVESFEELHKGMKLPGIVNNITAFGAFVDLGIHENGLIHISKLSRKRVAAVSEVLKLGQRIEATVIDIDYARRRISLSLID